MRPVPGDMVDRDVPAIEPAIVNQRNLLPVVECAGHFDRFRFVGFAFRKPVPKYLRENRLVGLAVIVRSMACVALRNQRGSSNRMPYRRSSGTTEQLLKHTSSV